MEHKLVIEWGGPCNQIVTCSLQRGYFVSQAKTVKVPFHGAKVVRQGIRVIRHGIKPNKEAQSRLPDPKPTWLRVKAPSGGGYQAVKGLVKKNKLSTVCEEAMCPNIGECWGAGTATFMLMGSTCTRACRFCAVDTGNPKRWLDPLEPRHTAEAVHIMGLKYVVLTSVNRDDLPDGGACHFARTVREIKRFNPETAVEALTPDFQGHTQGVQEVLDSDIDVYAQNLETVKRLTHPIRDRRAGYEQTLDVLAFAKHSHPHVLTKTSLMLGLGETEAELLETMDDLRAIGIDILTLGQYLRPTINHLPVIRYVSPEDFQKYRQWGLNKGFLEVVSGPFVRSSYRAEKVIEKNNVGLEKQGGSDVKTTL